MPHSNIISTNPRSLLASSGIATILVGIQNYFGLPNPLTAMNDWLFSPSVSNAAEKTESLTKGITTTVTTIANYDVPNSFRPNVFQEILENMGETECVNSFFDPNYQVPSLTPANLPVIPTTSSSLMSTFSTINPFNYNFDQYKTLGMSLVNNGMYYGSYVMQYSFDALHVLIFANNLMKIAKAKGKDVNVWIQLAIAAVNVPGVAEKLGSMLEPHLVQYGLNKEDITAFIQSIPLIYIGGNVAARKVGNKLLSLFQFSDKELDKIMLDVGKSLEMELHRNAPTEFDKLTSTVAGNSKMMDQITSNLIKVLASQNNNPQTIVKKEPVLLVENAPSKQDAGTKKKKENNLDEKFNTVLLAYQQDKKLRPTLKKDNQENSNNNSKSTSIEKEKKKVKA